jgi:hypothetical protein
MKIFKTEYSFGLNDENAKCDIHEIESIGIVRKLKRGKVRENYLAP